MSQAPENVRLEFADGSKVPCTVERAEHLDRETKKGTVEYYLARPDEHVDPALTYQVAWDKLYPMTGLKLETGNDQRSLLDWAPPQ